VASFAAIAPKAVKAAIATLIRDQDNAARRPFTTFCEGFSGAGYAQVTCDTPPIPAGEEVVIESVSVAGLADPNNFVFVPQVTTSESGVEYIFKPAPMTDSNLNQPFSAYFQGAQSSRLYADPGSVISCLGTTPRSSVSTIAILCSYSGYSITLP
jgi:hypothetical protein